MATRPRDLTVKQRKLIKGVVEGKSQKQAAIDAGYSPKSAETIASQELNKTQVKASLVELMEEAGLSDTVLLAKHKELLNATTKDIPDYPVQKGALEMAYKLKGAFVEKKEVSFPEGLIMEVSFGDD